MIQAVFKVLDFRKPVIVACSGGLDSIAAASFLHKTLKSSVEMKLFHFNHGQGEANNLMEESVKHFAELLGVELILANTEQYQPSRSSSLEASLREARLAAMNDLCRHQVVCCHHLNDCVESYLMNCFNGVPEYYPIPIHTELENCRIVRPFLLTHKSDFHEHLMHNGQLGYVVEDYTNFDSAFRRNFVRNEVLPLIKQRWVGIDKVVRKKVEKQYKEFLKSR